MIEYFVKQYTYSYLSLHCYNSSCIYNVIVYIMYIVNVLISLIFTEIREGSVIGEFPLINYGEVAAAIDIIGHCCFHIIKMYPNYVYT